MRKFLDISEDRPMADAETTEAAKPAERTGPVLDQQTEELFRFIESLKKLKENEDLEKVGVAAVIAPSNKGGLATLALGLTALAALSVVAYGIFTWATATQERVISDPVEIMTNARTAFEARRYDEAILWANRILEKEQQNSKADIQEAVLILVKGRMALDQIKIAGLAVDKYSSRFDSDSGASAERRGEFHHLEGELWLKLGRLGPDQRFKEAYEADRKSFARLKDKLRYIQCLISEPKDLNSQLTMLDELEKEVNDNTSAQAKDRSDLIEKIRDWRRRLVQLKS